MREIEPTIRKLEDLKKQNPRLRYWLEGGLSGVAIISSLNPNIPPLVEKVKEK